MLRRLIATAFAGILVVGCADKEEDRAEDVLVQEVLMDAAGELPAEEDLLEPPDARWEVGAWEVVEPGGETGCSDGSPFRFFVRKGDPKRALVFMQGGGACWNLMTCMMGPAMSRPDVPTFEQFKQQLADKDLAGILDLDAEKHPFPDWTVVYIPYCSSDLHWGRTDHAYSEKLTVPHRGFFNASSAYQWLYDQVKEPDAVVLTGASAGGYGVLLHSAWVAQHYSEATIRVVVDAAAGVVAGDFTQVSMEVWQAEPSLPTFIPAVAAADPSTMTFSQMFEGIAGYYPQHRYALYSTAFDDQQAFFYKVMGGKTEEWPAKLQETVAQLTGALSNLSIYVPAGTMHTVLPFEAFYERERSGVLFADWLTQFALGETVPADVNCQESECSVDPICEACPPAESGDRPFHCDVCEALSN